MVDAAYEICDRCGANIVVGRRHRKTVDVFVLCEACMEHIQVVEDRLDVLEGFVEEVEKMAKPIR
jgi:RNA polymerase-binding transcription factor DksA